MTKSNYDKIKWCDCINFSSHIVFLNHKCTIGLIAILSLLIWVKSSINSSFTLGQWVFLLFLTLNLWTDISDWSSNFFCNFTNSALTRQAVHVEWALYPTTHLLLSLFGSISGHKTNFQVLFLIKLIMLILFRCLLSIDKNKRWSVWYVVHSHINVLSLLD